MFYRDQIRILRVIDDKGVAVFAEVTRGLRNAGVSSAAAMVYIGRLRKRGAIRTTYRQIGRSRFAIHAITPLGRKIIAAWDLLQSVSPTGWPYGKKRPRR
jgi:hypothetical protein